MQQLISYIALGAPATRRPATGNLLYLRPEIGFTPNWYHKSLGIDFGQKWHTNPDYRKQSLAAMRNEIDHRFPGNTIGKHGDFETPDLLTGLFGACSIAAIYGVPVRYEKDQWPVSEHVPISDEEMGNLQPPDLSVNPFFQKIMEQVDWIARNEGKVYGFMNWQGVLNNVQRIRGQELFMDFYMNPAVVKNLLNCVCTTMIDAAKIIQQKQRESGVEFTFFTVSNCLVNMLSPELYNEFILPFDQKIAESFETIGIHNCAWSATPYLSDYAKVPKVGYIDMGMDSDLETAKLLFPETRRAIMYTPMDVANKSSEEIKKDMEYIAAKYGPCDIVAADIEFGTPDKKILDLIEICEGISYKYENQNLVMRAVLTTLFILSIPVLMKAQLAKSTFFQDIKTDVQLPPEAGKNVIKLFSTIHNVIAVTPNGIYRYQNGNWAGKPNGLDWRTATVDKQGKIWLASTKTIQQENSKEKFTLPESLKNDTVLCLFWEDEKTLHVGTTGSLLTWNGKWNMQTEIKARVNSIAFDAQKQLWVATTDGLWRRSSGQWVNMDETLMDRGNERTYFSLRQQKEGAEILLSTPYSVGCISETGNHWVLRASDGLPFGPIKVIVPVDGGLWFGTDKGAIRKDSGWNYFNGRRWLPDDKVNDILPVDARTVWVATPNGISQIQQVEMTLEQKARIFEENIEKRHNRLGLINHAYLKIPGDLSTSYTENEDNDGLWTACFLAAECFRYGVTKSDDAKTKAVRTFEALERLETVTGISGYPARSYALATDSIKQSRSPHPKHWHPSPDGKWQWLDDTSSDEIVGHIFTIALFHDLVADEVYKERSIRLIERILNNIVDNNYVIIDFDGKPTRWGIWNPDSLNHSQNWMYERGLNSLQILSHLKTGVSLTGNPKFEKAYKELVEKHGYAKNAVQAKQYGPFETSHSDDILNFFPYYNLFKYAKDDPNFSLYSQSLERSWKAVESDRMPVWNIIASALLKKDCGLKTALEELKQFPIDQVNWTMDNRHRWDLERDQMAGRGGNPQTVHPIPSPESGVSRWNTNPKNYVAGNGGKTEETGTHFLFAYWMGRYYGLIKD